MIASSDLRDACFFGLGGSDWIIAHWGWIPPRE
jgi:hypothetical protein